jgi:colicin import membrane protein
MNAAADRLEFAPPPEPALVRAFILAVVAHLLLLLALTYGFHWQRESQDAAVEAELWSAVPREVAPKEVPQPPPPPPQPVVKVAPQPEPPARSDADIALEREKQRRLLEQKRHEEELKREREERAKAEAQKKRDEELARKKELQKQQQLADAKRKQQQEQQARDEKMREQLRQDTMKRNLAMAGTGAPSATGNAARASGPSASWGGKVQARVRPNIVFPDNVSGNPVAQVEVRLGPGGMILGSPRLVKSSGVKSWDDAVLRALEKTESLPPDTDGRYPSPVIIEFKPKA